MALINAGLWFVFMTWTIALHLCGDQRGNPGDPGELAVGEHGRPCRDDDHAVYFSTRSYPRRSTNDTDEVPPTQLDWVEPGRPTHHPDSFVIAPTVADRRGGAWQQGDTRSV